MAERAAYLRDGTAIYERSFAIIRAEADLSRFSAEQADVAVRMIHACGQVELARHIVFGGDVVAAARRALIAGAPIFCDSEMVARGITRACYMTDQRHCFFSFAKICCHVWPQFSRDSWLRSGLKSCAQPRTT